MTLFKSAINFWTICQVCHSVCGMTNFWPKIYLGYTEEKPHKNLSPFLIVSNNLFELWIRGWHKLQDKFALTCLLVKSRAMCKLKKGDFQFAFNREIQLDDLQLFEPRVMSTTSLYYKDFTREEKVDDHIRIMHNNPRPYCCNNTENQGRFYTKGNNGLANYTGK